MEQNRPVPRRALSPKERRRRHRIRLVRNWTVFLLSCGAVMAVMTGGILWLLPRAYALIAPPTPELAVADDATSVSLEAEAAAAYREMAEAAKQDEIELVLTAGYQDAAARQSAYEAAVQSYRESGCSEEEATAKAATVQPAPEASEYATGYGADILAADSMEKDTGFADTRAYEWLEAYAAEYGFILRWPQERQAATGMVFEPWHWRYVGRDNALAIRASGLSLEEYLALEQTK